MYSEGLQRSELVADEWTLGSVNAEITLLEYGDFECPYCRAARPVMEGLVSEDPETIRLVFRHFPLTTVHRHALLAAQAAEASGAQGKFWQMHDVLFTEQPALDLGNLHIYAKALRLDLARFDRELDEGVYIEDIKRDFRNGIRDGVNGTPTIFINGRRYDGPRERNSMLAAIATRLHARTSVPTMFP